MTSDEGDMRQKLETAANGATLILVCAVLLVLGHRFFVEAKPAASASTDEISESLGVDFGAADRTMILVVQRSCSFCAARMPFYRSLIASRNSNHQRLQIIVAAPQRDGDITGYLQSEGVKPDRVVQIVKGDLPGIGVTPTLLVADSTGKLIAKWTGMLSATGQEAVQNLLFESSESTSAQVSSLQ